MNVQFVKIAESIGVENFTPLQYTPPPEYSAEFPVNVQFVNVIQSIAGDQYAPSRYTPPPEYAASLFSNRQLVSVGLLDKKYIPPPLLELKPLRMTRFSKTVVAPSPLMHWSTR